MSEQNFLFDTYALMEILNKNPNYLKYTETGAVINEFIFAEFCYKLFRESAEKAHEYLHEIAPAIVHASPKIIQEAMRFRVENKRKNFSMTDCISYFMARDLEIKFLTGDKEFEGFDNVEFVK